nr:RnfABCDGE type electron transport complex subunit G [Lachnospiraceae bacterium]
MKSMLKDAAILLLITVVAGLALGYVYFITKTPIAKAEERAVNEALGAVFADAASFPEKEDNFPYPANEDNVKQSAWEQAGFKDDVIDKVYLANDSAGNLLGYVLSVTTKAGYGGDISFLMGIRKDGTLNGISILKISETAGLGMKAPEVLVPQFSGRKVSGFLLTKSGASSPEEIDAISGATITSKAVTTAVNAGLAYFEVELGGGSDE